MTLSPDQLEMRKLGITATDMAAILGHNPWRSAIDVWREKRGDVEPFKGNVRSKWGILLEPVIRADYEERHGVHVEVPGTLTHRDHEWWKASPDGLVYLDTARHAPERGLEIKTHTFRAGFHYGAPGTDEVPAWELVQCLWNMGCVPGVNRWDLVVFMDGQPAEYIIDRDDELIGMLHERAAQFKRDNIDGGAVPDPNGTEHDKKTLAKVWGKTTGNLIDIGDDLATFDLVEEARKLREHIADDGDALEKVEQALKAKIADADGLTWKNAKGKPEKITWKHSKEQRRIDFGAVVADMKGTAAIAAQAKAADVERLLTCLKSIGGEPMGHSIKAHMTGGEGMEIVQALQTALVSIAKSSTEPQRTTFFKTRPMYFPKNWKAPKAQEQ